jgi:hypothetical protein
MEHSFRYAEETTSGNIIVRDLPACLVAFDTMILRNDSNNNVALPQFVNGETVIDADFVEAHKARTEGRNRNKSMDLMFSVDDAEGNESYLVLVELKLNYLDVRRNLRQDDLEDKVSGSLLVLQNNVAVYPTFYFIFANHLIEQAINKLSRFYPDPKVRQTRKAATIEELKQLFFGY